MRRFLAGTARVSLVGLALFGLPVGCRLASPPKPVQAALFTDIAARAHVDFHHRNGQISASTLMNTTGSGCAVFDYDNDGWLDVYLVNGKSPPGDGNHLYHNNHDGTFTDVTAQAGVAGLGHGSGMGCAVGDYDGDGWLDLYVTYWGQNLLYRNQGDGTFKDVTATAGVGTRGFSTAAAFADLDGDGYPDLYVARYCVFTERSKQLCDNTGVPGSCPPYTYPAEPDVVYRNDGHGHFQDVTRPWGMAEEGGRGLGVAVVDYDDDGKLDLFVSNDGSSNYLYRNLGHGHFKNVAAEEGIALVDTKTVANMGCDFGDFFGDGSLCAVTGTFQDEIHPLWRYSPTTAFELRSANVGMNAITQSLLTYGIGFADFDNDGWLDLMLANGHVNDHVNQYDPRHQYAQPRLYLHNNGQGKVEDWTARGGSALTTPMVGRGMAFGDLFNDGGMALVINNVNGPAQVLRNDHPRQHWAGLRLLGRGPAWEAIGAKVTLTAGGRTQHAYVHTSYSFASANDPRLHFGLGAVAQVEAVTVRWPDGKTSEHRNVPVDKITTLVEPGATPPAPQL